MRRKRIGGTNWRTLGRLFMFTIGSCTCAFQRTHYLTPKIQDGRDPPFWILTPKCKKVIFSKTKQFRAMVSIDDL